VSDAERDTSISSRCFADESHRAMMGLLDREEDASRVETSASRIWAQSVSNMRQPLPKSATTEETPVYYFFYVLFSSTYLKEGYQ
jgi:hypothetical protein